MTQISAYAGAYVSRYGMELVPLPPRSKVPTSQDWGSRTLKTKTAAVEYFTKHPDANMGVALGPSRLCSLDVDNLDATRQIFEGMGLDLDGLVAATPTIQGRPGGFRLMFRVPADTELPYHSLTWPKQDGGGGRFTVFELRSSSDGKQRQDVLPPSIHPDTGLEYVWLTKPNGTIPDPPAFLLTIWREWDRFKPQLQSFCPWVGADVPPQPKQSNPGDPGVSVISKFNENRPIESVLEQYGYKRLGARWLSPHSTTGLPGVHVFPDGRCWIHHASDPLCSDESGQPVGAFDFFCYYEHKGDAKAAVKAAAKELGLTRKLKTNPAPAAPTKTEVIDRETGEIMAPVDWLSLLECNKSGPLSNLDNAVRVLDQDPAWRGKIWYDEFLRRVLTIGGDGQSREWADADSVGLAVYMQRNIGMTRLGVQTANDAVSYVARKDIRNECREWMQSLVWDGTHRLEHLMPDGFGAEDTVYTRSVGRCWITSIVARVMDPGCKVDTVPVFEGTEGLFKSTALSILGGKWFVECHESVLSKDFYMVLDGHMLAEICEMHSFSRSEVERVKGVISCRFDRYRAPYERRAETHPRMAVLSGTTNQDDWNKSSTGARRFWPILCTEVNLDLIRSQRDQLFAEALSRYKSGQPWWDVPVDDAALETEKRRDSDSWESTIRFYLGARTQVQMNEILKDCLGIEVGRQTQTDQKRAGRCLRALGYSSQAVRNEDNYVVRSWVKKPK